MRNGREDAEDDEGAGAGLYQQSIKMWERERTDFKYDISIYEF